MGKSFTRDLINILLTLNPSNAHKKPHFPENKVTVLLTAWFYLKVPRANMNVQTENASLHLHSIA